MIGSGRYHALLHFTLPLCAMTCNCFCSRLESAIGAWPTIVAPWLTPPSAPATPTSHSVTTTTSGTTSATTSGTTPAPRNRKPSTTAAGADTESDAVGPFDVSLDPALVDLGASFPVSLLLGLATGSVLVGVQMGQSLLATLVELGEMSEEILRGDRLPTLKTHPESQSEADSGAATP